jgi:hypothetical protein
MATPNLKFILETILEDQPKPMSKDENEHLYKKLQTFQHWVILYMERQFRRTC